ncbi:hypothetical protein [Sphingobium yanoikuyae]|uniref:hypothetical protein n=1 Tax=Sphingobium yanoikuyae TaxID=13690 RepID=UPI0028AF8386|nr:hypothetical protein [Sphingobium yanoikuyae]
MVPLSEGPKKFFRLSPDEREALGGFAVHRGAIEERLDVNYHSPEYVTPLLQLEAAFPDIRPLSAYAVVTCGPFGSAIKSDDYRASGIPLIRISDIEEDGTIDPRSIVFIDEDLSMKHASSQVRPGDIVISQRGTIGLPAVVPTTFPLWHISANLIAVKNPEVSLDYVRDYLGSTFAQAHFARRNSGQIQSKITTSDVASLPFPLVENASALSALLEVARAARDSGLAAAERALNGLDAFILDELGVNLPPPHDDTPFAISRASLRNGGKIFPNYYNPDRRHAVAELRRIGADFLDSVVHFVREQRTISADDQTYVGLANVRSNTGEYVDADDDVGGTVAVFAKGDVLFAKLRPYLNKVWVSDRAGVCSPEFHVLRLRADGPIESP